MFKKLSANGRTMIEGCSTNYLKAVLTKKIDRSTDTKKFITLPEGHTIGRPKKMRPISAMTTADVRPTVAQIIPFLHMFIDKLSQFKSCLFLKQTLC